MGKGGYTYEVSNIGVVRAIERAEVQLEKLVFTQCAMPAGPAVACSVVSVVDGPLVLSLTWQEGVVEEGFMAEIKAGLESRLMSLEG